MIQYAISAYGFLLERKAITDASQFALAIRAYSSHKRSQIVAQEVERSRLLFYRTIAGTVTAYGDEEQAA